MSTSPINSEDQIKIHKKNILIGCTGSVATIKIPVLVQKLTENGNFNVKVVATEHSKHFFTPEDISGVEVITDADEWNAWNKRGDPVVHIELCKWADLFLIAPLDANTLGKMAGKSNEEEGKGKVASSRGHLLNRDFIKEGYTDLPQKYETDRKNLMKVIKGGSKGVTLVDFIKARRWENTNTGLCDNLLTCIARAWNLEKPLFFCPAMNTKMYEHPITSTQILTLVSWGYLEIPVTSKVLVCGDKGLGAMAEVDTIVQTVVDFLNRR